MSGHLALLAGLIAALAVAVAAAAAAGLIARHRLITRRGGVVACTIRLAPGRPWRQGLAEYQASRLCWHRSASLTLRPAACFDRAGLRIVRTRRGERGEAGWLGPDVVVAECEAIDGSPGDQATVRHLELAMSRAALTGLLAWLESSPEFYLRAS